MPLFLKTDIELKEFDTAMSVFPSPSISPNLIQEGLFVPAKSIRGANDRFPGVLVFIKIEMVFELK